MQLLSWLSLADFGLQHTTGNDCWSYTSPSGREYAIIGLSDGTGFVEVTDPGDPQLVAMITGPSSLWRDMKVYQQHAYSVSEGGAGIQVFNLTSIDSGVVTLVGNITTGGTSATHNVAVDTQSGFLYRCGGGATSNNIGLRVYSLANPASPSFVGEWNLAYVHDAQVVTYTSGPFAGRQIAFACTDGAATPGLDVIDVTNKSNIFRITRVVYSNPAFSHQVWLSPDRQYAYLNDELDEDGFTPSTTYIFNVSNINNPFEVTPAFDNGNPAVTHNLYTKDNFIYQANYTSGIRIYDATNPTSLNEVAFFDTFPSSDSVSFNGLWSVCPYFQRDQLVIGSDMQSGLFIWWHGAPVLEFDFLAGDPETIDPDGDSVPLQIHELSPGDLQAGTALLHYNVGLGFVSTALTALGGEDFLAPFPSLPCGSQVQFYLTAQTSEGVTWSYPPGGGNAHLEARAAEGESAVLSDAFESSSGWAVGFAGDTATTGIWTRVNPIGTSAQPENDHTEPLGVLCWVTGQGTAGGADGENDVDGGATTLVSPAFDMSTLQNPLVSYYRWYSNNAGTVDDVFRVDIRSNGGSWVNVETLGPTGPGTMGGWLHHSFLVSTFVAPSSSVQLRFVASDTGSGSIVEAGLDDFAISDLICDTASFYCTGKTTSQGCVPFMSADGTPSVTSGSFRIMSNNHVEGESGIILYSFEKTSLNFHGGKLCVKAPFVRLSTLITPTDGQPCTGCAQPACRMFKRNFNQLIQSGNDPMLTAGQTVFAQYRQRDPADPTGFGDNLSDGVMFTIAP